MQADKGSWVKSLYLKSKLHFCDLKIKYENWHPYDAFEKIKKEMRKSTQEYARFRAGGKRIAISNLLEKVGELEELSVSAFLLSFVTTVRIKLAN